MKLTTLISVACSGSQRVCRRVLLFERRPQSSCGRLVERSPLVAQLSGTVLDRVNVHVRLVSKKPLQLIRIQYRRAEENASPFIGIEAYLKAVEVRCGFAGSAAVKVHAGIIRLLSISRSGLLKPLKLPCTVKRFPTSPAVAFAVAAVSTAAGATSCPRRSATNVNGQRAVASAASFTILIYYAIANLAALRMPPQGKLYPDAVPLVGLVSCAVLAMSLALPVVVIGTGVLSAGFLVRELVRRFDRGGTTSRRRA